MLLHSQDWVPEHFPILKLQTSPGLFANAVVSFGEKDEKFGRTFFFLVVKAAFI